MCYTLKIKIVVVVVVVVVVARYLINSDHINLAIHNFIFFLQKIEFNTV